MAEDMADIDIGFLRIVELVLICALEYQIA
jgi:hypothetical protein